MSAVPESHIVAEAKYDPGTISAPAFYNITFEDGRRLLLRGKDAKRAFKKYRYLRPGDEFSV